MVSVSQRPAPIAELRAPRRLKKFLTSDEMDDRRLRGLCEICGEEFTPGHYLKHGKFRLYMVENEEIRDEEVVMGSSDSIVVKAESCVVELGTESEVVPESEKLVGVEGETSPNLQVMDEVLSDRVVEPDLPISPDLHTPEGKTQRAKKETEVSNETEMLLQETEKATEWSRQQAADDVHGDRLEVAWAGAYSSISGVESIYCGKVATVEMPYRVSKKISMETYLGLLKPPAEPPDIFTADYLGLKPLVSISEEDKKLSADMQSEACIAEQVLIIRKNIAELYEVLSLVSKSHFEVLKLQCKCWYDKVILRHLNFWDLDRFGDNSSMADIILFFLWTSYNLKDFLIGLAALWYLWWIHNKAKPEQDIPELTFSAQRIKMPSKQFYSSDFHKVLTHFTSSTSYWSKPPMSFLKCNCGVSWLNSSATTGTRVCLRDSNGLVCAVSVVINRCNSVDTCKDIANLLCSTIDVSFMVSLMIDVVFMRPPAKPPKDSAIDAVNLPQDLTVADMLETNWNILVLVKSNMHELLMQNLHRIITAVTELVCKKSKLFVICGAPSQDRLQLWGANRLENGIAHAGDLSCESLTNDLEDLGRVVFNTDLVLTVPQIFSGTVTLLAPWTSDVEEFVRDGALITMAMVMVQVREARVTKVGAFMTHFEKTILDKHGDAVNKIRSILQSGIVDGGGRNVTIRFLSRTKHDKVTAVAGLAVFSQYGCYSLIYLVSFGKISAEQCDLSKQLDLIVYAWNEFLLLGEGSGKDVLISIFTDMLIIEEYVNFGVQMYRFQMFDGFLNQEAGIAAFTLAQGPKIMPKEERQEIFLCALISNAPDALNIIRFKSLPDKSRMDGQPALSIHIIPPKANTTLNLTLIDIGMGLTKADLVNNLGTIIGRSGAREYIEALAASAGVSLCGRLGVVFYSAYLVVKKVIMVIALFSQPRPPEFKTFFLNLVDKVFEEGKICCRNLSRCSFKLCEILVEGKKVIVKAMYIALSSLAV